ncbi:MAG: zinc ribbon domain-containing protein [Clostridia bacterium]|nr:zinc ribbon domain-containing protein [Clostridia bacterium]
MYCSNCGAPLKENAEFCDVCGANQPQLYAEKPLAENDPMNLSQGQLRTDDPQPSEFKLGWYHFLIYFSLFAAAALQVYNAMQMFTGLQYAKAGVLPDEAHARFSALKPLDMTFGVLLLLDAAFIIVTRFLLAKFKKSGPICLYLCSVFAIVLSLAYTITINSIVGVDPFEVNALGEVVGQSLVVGAILIYNIVYFTKRKSLFVN